MFSMNYSPVYRTRTNSAYGSMALQSAAYKCPMKTDCAGSHYSTKVYDSKKKDYSVLKTAGLAFAAAILAYKGKNIISCVLKGMKQGAISTKQFISAHTKGSVHEALGGVYHTFAGTGKIITSPIKAIGSLLKKAPKT